MADHTSHNHAAGMVMPTTPAVAADGHSGHSNAFHFGVDETVLFDFWRTESVAGIILTAVIVVVLCFVMEFIRFYRNLRKVEHRREQLQNAAHRQKSLERSSLFTPRLTRFAVLDALLLSAQLIIAYVLMLVFMTFNFFLCAAVIVGEAGAHFLFAVLFPEEFTRLPTETDETGCAGH